MAHPLLGEGYVATENGEFVSAAHQRIHEIIQDYSKGTMFLAYIRPSDRVTMQDLTHPFAVVQDLPNGESVVVFTLREDEVDHRVLARIFAGDQTKHDVFAALAAEKAAFEAIKLKKEVEKWEETKEFAVTILKSKKHRFQHEGVRYD